MAFLKCVLSVTIRRYLVMEMSYVGWIAEESSLVSRPIPTEENNLGVIKLYWPIIIRSPK